MKRFLAVLAATLAQVARFFVRTKLKAQGRLAETSTMADYAKILAIPDDKGPPLRRPDPNAPHAELINRVRLYARNGARALGPLLDRPLLAVDGTVDHAALDDALIACDAVALPGSEEASIIDVLDVKGDDPQWDWAAIRAIHAAYNSPWTVKDGEVWEVVTDAKVTH